MGLITRTYGSATANPVATGSTILAAHVNTDLDTVYAAVNGNIEDANIKSAANIAISKTTLGTYTAPTSYSPSITGFSAITTQNLFYGQVGKFMYVGFQISGTSNAGTITFPLPNSATSNGQIDMLIRIADNGASNFSQGLLEISNGSGTVTIYKDILGSSFTSSGTKSAQGYIFIAIN